MSKKYSFGDVLEPGEPGLFTIAGPRPDVVPTCDRCGAPPVRTKERLCCVLYERDRLREALEDVWALAYQMDGAEKSRWDLRLLLHRTGLVKTVLGDTDPRRLPTIDPTPWLGEIEAERDRLRATLRDIRNSFHARTAGHSVGWSVFEEALTRNGIDPEPL